MNSSVTTDTHSRVGYKFSTKRIWLHYGLTRGSHMLEVTGSAKAPPHSASAVHSIWVSVDPSLHKCEYLIVGNEKARPSPLPPSQSATVS